MPQKNEERLQKYLAECGVASRRKSEELIAAGKVKVNGHVAQIGDKIDPRRDLVTVRGKKVRKTQRNYYILLQDRKSTRLNSSHPPESRMPSSA